MLISFSSYADAAHLDPVGDLGNAHTSQLEEMKLDEARHCKQHKPSELEIFCVANVDAMRCHCHQGY